MILCDIGPACLPVVTRDSLFFVVVKENIGFVYDKNKRTRLHPIDHKFDYIITNLNQIHQSVQ